MTLDNRGWATIIHHDSEPTTVQLTSEEENSYCLPLTPNDLTALCLAIATPTGLIRKPYLPDENMEVIIDLRESDSIKIIWGKKKVCTLNTVNFLTQAAPQFLHQYLHPEGWER